MSTTAVPLQPVSARGLWVLWVGILLLAIGAAAYAATVSRQPSIDLKVVKAGTGRFPIDSDVVIIKYEGRLGDGTVFDANEQAPLPVGRMIPGFSQGLKRMQVGGKYVLKIPAVLGYGPQGTGPIPPNSNLEFDVEVLDLKTEAEVQAMMQQQQMIQQMMQQQQRGGAGGEAPAGQ